MVDAEESWLQGAIDEALLTMMAKYNSSTAVVYTTLQMYRHDRLTYLHELYEKARQGGFHIGIKLVRGAYLEKENSRAEEAGTPSPLYGSKQETDHAYDAALEFCASHIDRIHLCAGTHNSGSTQKLAELMAQYQIAPEDKRVGFAQLLGMGDILTYNLAASGYNTAKYIPYGPLPALVPYLSRRMEENSAMRGQTATELGLIHAEIKRRKK
jgi:proline dehydrogenase